MKDLPRTLIHLVEDNKEIENPFLKVHHLKLKLEYDDGSLSEVFHHDVIERKHLDAVVICPVKVTENGLRVWLRSCIRPALGFRSEFPNSFSNQWEFAAGLIEPGEAPVEAARRELMEEIGFNIPTKHFSHIMDSWGSVGLCGEKLSFFYVNVSTFEREIPTEDGSPLERHGKCDLFTFDEAFEAGDLKTQAGALKLKDMFT